MKLNKTNVPNIPAQTGLEIPGNDLFHLPEKVLQFGTGVLLRGLPDYFIDKANKKGIFNGKIVVVKSTSTGGTDAFDEQDGLYTICIRGIEGETKIEENIISAAISRVLSAKNEWHQILQCAASPEMAVVISNTTEVGIALIPDDITASPPESFPGKLLAFLYHRYKAFNGDPTKGMVIVPTELIIDNGTKLRNILLQLATQNKLDDDFCKWLIDRNYFCNSLVDRIVPGKLRDDQQKEIENSLGYTDQLMIMSEPYRLWAIEAPEQKIAETLSFSAADAGVVLEKDINVYRELKLRLLNGAHSFGCGLAHLCGFVTVKEAMDNKYFGTYIARLMMHEIVPTIAKGNLSHELATAFAHKVIDRFRNPHIEHRWLSISAQYSSKMRMRNVPVIAGYYEQNTSTPTLMALGFAGFLLFMKSQKQNDHYTGNVDGKSYTIHDDNIPLFAEKWNETLSVDSVVKEIALEPRLWGTDTIHFPDFISTVSTMIHLLQTNGALQTLKSFVTQGQNDYVE